MIRAAILLAAGASAMIIQFEVPDFPDFPMGKLQSMGDIGGTHP